MSCAAPRRLSRGPRFSRLARLAALAALVACLVVLLARAALARDPVALHPGVDRYDLRGAADVLEDPGGALGIADVADGAARDAFRPLDPTHANIGYSPSAFWLRFRLRGLPDASSGCVLNLSRTPDLAELYERDGSAFRVTRSGAAMPFGARPIGVVGVAFPLVIPAGEERAYYVRLRSTDSIRFDLYLETQAGFADEIGGERLRDGIYYGIILGLVLYNAFVWLATRDKAYLFYVLFELSNALAQAGVDKYAFQYLWPAHPVWAGRAEQLFAATTILASLLFAREYLRLGRSRPIVLLAAVAAAFACAAPFTDSERFKTALGVYLLVAVLSLLAAGVAALRSGTRNARFFLVAWVLFIVGTFLAILTALGVLQGVDGFLAMKIGSAAEATLLALGLADRINEMRTERARAREELLRAKTEHAETLERRVEERTRELERALEKVKRAQDQLLRQERLAMMGRLVAEFVHEVGNPLNFAMGGASDLSGRLDAVAKGDAEAMSEARSSLALVLAGHERIKKIVENLRSFVRARAVAMEPTDVVEEVRSSLALARKALEKSAIEVVTRIDALPSVEARPGELSQVFTNLVLNACDAMGEGGTLTIDAHAEEGGVRVEISDTGPGVPAEERTKIFEPFFSGTRERAASREGMGLGLYVSHEIVARHGGRLSVTDAEGGGARFVVVLPRTAPAPPSSGT